MAKVIVPKNHTLTNSVNHLESITGTTATLDAGIYPTFIYSGSDIVVDWTIRYAPSGTISGTIINTTTSPNYTVRLFDSTSPNNKEVRFIKLTLRNFPTYLDNRTQTGNLILTRQNSYIKIYKKSNSTSYDCRISVPFQSVNGHGSVNGTYWLEFNTSTNKYTYSTSEPLLVSKAIVPNKDNWMNSTITEYAPPISTSMTIDTGDGCNQPYIGRNISIYNVPSSATTIRIATTYKLTINTDDKILLINSISLGKFIGPQSTTSAVLTFNIYINSNTRPVHTSSITIRGHAAGEESIQHSIGVSYLYIDVKNNAVIPSSDLSKAIDAF